MMVLLQAGQVCVGTLRSYKLLKMVNHWSKNVWVAKPVNNDPSAREVVVKTGDEIEIQNEARYLTLFAKHPRIRQLIDTIGSDAIVLEHSETDLRTTSISRKLSTSEIKTITRHVLEGLESMHAAGVVHTDIKPQNILLSGLDNESKSAEKLQAQVADLGSASESSNFLISPRSFRSPEVWLGLSWGPPTDIWSLGAVVASLMMGPHGEAFGSSAPTAEDREFEMVYRHHSMMGSSFPAWMVEQTSQTWKDTIKDFYALDKANGTAITWRQVIEELDIPKDSGSFVERMLVLDPTKRPTASELLKDKWLEEK